MLTLTETASTVVKTIVSQSPDAATEGGLRIDAAEGGSPDFALSVVAAPEPADAVVENAGARVFVEETAAEVLADKVLDAQVGQDGSVQFAIALQE